MAITFQEQLKRQKNMIIVFIVLILITAVIIWRGILVEPKIDEKIIPKYFKDIEIDFSTLKDPRLEEFNLMERIPHFEGQVGRQNPFIPAQ
jgi:hypothetical protein